MDPQQELFTAIRTLLCSIHGNVYDGALPMECPYPFDYIAESYQSDTANKSAIFGTVTQTIHVWHNDPSKRGTLSKRMLEIKQVAQNLERTANFRWQLVSTNQRILPDNTTKKPLLHGVLELGFRFS